MNYINNNFKITAGIRLDIPVFMDDPLERPGFNDTTVAKLQQYYDLKGARSGQMPKSQFLWSPRVGFNWDVKVMQRSSFVAEQAYLHHGFHLFGRQVPIQTMEW
ncbi:MAG: hypothetical protein R2764_07465 [Bacteroidales bacterium]